MEVVLAFHLKGDTPSEVIEVLEYMIREDPLNASAPPFELPDHPFFQDDPSAGFYLYRQDWLFFTKMDEGYFANIPHANMYQYGPGQEYRVSIRTNIPFYWVLKVDEFLDWLKPYIMGAGNGDKFVGYWRSEFEDLPVTILHV